MTAMFDSAVTAGVEWTNDASVAAAIARIATTHNDKLVIVKMGSLAFDKGKRGGGNVAPTVAREWDAFSAVHHAEGSGRAKPSEATRINYVSGYDGIAAIGWHKAYDGLPVFEYAMAPAQRKLLKGADKIGAYCRKVLEAHPDKAPTLDQLKALLPAAKVKTAGDVIDSVEEELVEAFGDAGTYRKLFADNPAAVLLILDMLAAVDAFKRKVPRENVEGVNYKAEAAKLRKQIADAAKAKADAEKKAE